MEPQADSALPLLPLLPCPHARPASAPTAAVDGPGGRSTGKGKQGQGQRQGQGQQQEPTIEAVLLCWGALDVTIIWMTASGTAPTAAAAAPAPPPSPPSAFTQRMLGLLPSLLTAPGLNLCWFRAEGQLAALEVATGARLEWRGRGLGGKGGGGEAGPRPVEDPSVMYWLLHGGEPSETTMKQIQQAVLPTYQVSPQRPA